jgi:hypothetical protein
MIEIRELVIRATIDESPKNNGGRNGSEVKSGSSNKKECCSENMDLLLQIINDKKER